MNARQKTYVRNRLKELYASKSKWIQEHYKSLRRSEPSVQEVLDMIHSGKAEFVVPRSATRRGGWCGNYWPDFEACVRINGKPLHCPKEKARREKAEAASLAEFNRKYAQLTDQVELGAPLDGQALIDEFEKFLPVVEASR